MTGEGEAKRIIDTYLRDQSCHLDWLACLRQVASTKKDRDAADYLFLCYYRDKCLLAPQESGNPHPEEFRTSLPQWTIPGSHVKKMPIFDGEDSEVGNYKYFVLGTGHLQCGQYGCQNRPGSKETLKNHARSHHGIKISYRQDLARLADAHRCNLCSKSFSRIQTLSSHIRRVHPVFAANHLAVPATPSTSGETMAAVEEGSGLTTSASQPGLPL